MLPNRDHVGLPLFPWGLLGIVTIPLGILAVIAYCRIFPPILLGDVDYYAAALPALISDAPLYDPASLGPHILPPPPFWDQAPSTAIFSAFLLLPGGKLIWGLLMAASVIAGILVLMPRLGAGVVLFAPVVVALPPVIEGMAWSNLNALVFLMLAIAWRWPRQAGWAIGVAAAAKLMPILGVAWLAGRRDWRGVGVAVAILVALTALAIILTSPSVIVDFITLRINQQPSPDEVRFGLADVGVPMAIIWLLAAAATAAAAWKASFSLAVLAMLLAAPAVHIHSVIFLLVPALGIWAPWVINRGREPGHVRAV